MDQITEPQIIQSPPKKSKWKLVLKISGILVVMLIGIYVFFYFYPGLLVKSTILDRPEANAIPVARQIAPIQTENASSYYFKNLKFEVPWLDPVEVKTSDIGITFKFTNGKRVHISEDMDVYEKFVSGGNLTPKEKSTLQDFYNTNGVNSNYTFYKTMYETNPGEISIFTPRQIVAWKSIMIILKSTLIVDTPIYTFEHNNFKGFQYGYKDGSTMHLFDQGDNTYQLAFSKFTQEEIDFVLASLNIE